MDQVTALDLLGTLGMLACIVGAIELERAPLTLRKVGGLWHWRLGRVGGSFYMSSKKGNK